MGLNYSELDYRQTPLGDLILRRRRVLSMGGAAVYEVKLDDQFLMSSIVNDSEIALARLTLAKAEGGDLDVVVGGLGLGYTARAVLDHPGVRSVQVVEYLPAVIDWHRRGLVPLGAELTGDPRCRILQGDFFAMLDDEMGGLDPERPDRRFHAILVDIDHSPRSLLHERHRPFYETGGLARVAERLHPGGVYGLWSADPPDERFRRVLERVFPEAEAHPVSYYHPLLDTEETNTVYLARRASDTST
jgi:spermidine synthase